MSTEIVLFYTDRFFGTADAISFRPNPKTGRHILRIHDLKTGVVGDPEKHFEQLKVYAALFCLEYKWKPSEIDICLGVYKKDEVREDNLSCFRIRNCGTISICSDGHLSVLQKSR